MAAVTCARCGLEVESTRTGVEHDGFEGRTPTASIVRHRRDGVRVSDLDCPDLHAAILAASQSGHL
jgi:hypothetical protein